jgi:sulfhydrogenase subunit delta
VQALGDGGLREAEARGRRRGPVELLATSTPVRDHVRVDVEVHGCPVSRHELLEVVSAWLAGREPVLPEHALCIECRQHGVTCVLVGDGAVCLGPVTRAGCGALCPSCGRGCYGCFGPAPGADVGVLVRRLRELGTPDEELADRLRMVTPRAPAFARAALTLEVAP